MKKGLWMMLSMGCAYLSWGQVSQTSSVLDGSGSRSSGGAYTNLSAAGQPGGIAVSSGGGYVNYAGFLNTFVLQPGLDTDGDGLADEVDADNDGDTLADATELAGDAFDPSSPTDLNDPDSDGDGSSDGAEAVAGTNPGDPNALLVMTDIQNLGPAREVAWTARGNEEKTYVVRAATAPDQPYDTVIFSNTVAGGAAPWYEVTATAAHPTNAAGRVYAVEVLP